MALSDLKATCNENSINLQNIADSMEQHLNCLEALSIDVEHRHLKSIIKSKLPKKVNVKLESNNTYFDWKVADLCKEIKRYLGIYQSVDLNKSNINLNCGVQENMPASDNNSERTYKSNLPIRGTADSLVATLDARRKEAKGNCYGCLRPKHTIKEY